MTGKTLDGGAYVLDPADLEYRESDGWHEALVAGSKRGASALGQRAVRLDPGASGGRRYPDSETVLFVLAGRGELAISDRRFELEPESGAFVAPDETFTLRNTGDEPLRLTLTVCPESEGIDGTGRAFDESHANRVVNAADQERHTTGDRFYHLLVDARLGCRTVTQFIGGIPRSRPREHYHEYEEAITILDGEGCMHIGNRSAPVSPGSMIFLPRGQRHSLECTSDSGMRLVGVFHPSGSPAVSYD